MADERPAHALPDCDHLDWGKFTEYATWTCAPGEEPEELPLRKQQVAAQGLKMAGKPHLCREVDGRELWAVALTPVG